MSTEGGRRLFICYIPGLDARRIDRQSTPYIHDLLASHPAVGLRTLPSTELLPTLLTGVYPHEHGIWQVKLKPVGRTGLSRRPVDYLPDVVTTTFQCFRQYTDTGYDLSTIPPRRRRGFELYRFKYRRRERSAEVLDQIGRKESILGLLGSEARYLFNKSFRTLDALLAKLPSPGLALEFFELYAFDLFEHWNLDRPDAMQRACGAVDRFVRQLHERCRNQGTTLMLLVDHGQERVVGVIRLQSLLDRSGVPKGEYSQFVEVALARFWFHTDRARRCISELLRSLDHTVLLGYRDLHAYHVCFEDDAYGEIYLAADPGHIFFPHDFYQPVANAFLALSEPTMRGRLFRPVHRGNHGYLPQHPSERGYMVLLDSNRRATRAEADLIDFAPSVLAYLGRRKPDHMRGSSAFDA